MKMNVDRWRPLAPGCSSGPQGKQAATLIGRFKSEPLPHALSGVNDNPSCGNKACWSALAIRRALSAAAVVYSCLWIESGKLIQCLPSPPSLLFTDLSFAISLWTGGKFWWSLAQWQELTVYVIFWGRLSGNSNNVNCWLWGYCGQDNPRTDFYYFLHPWKFGEGYFYYLLSIKIKHSVNGKRTI